MQGSADLKRALRSGWWFFLMVGLISLVTVPIVFGVLLSGGVLAVVVGSVPILRKAGSDTVARSLFWVLIGIALLVGPAAYTVLALFSR